MRRKTVFGWWLVAAVAVAAGADAGLAAGAGADAGLVAAAGAAAVAGAGAGAAAGFFGDPDLAEPP